MAAKRSLKAAFRYRAAAVVVGLSASIAWAEVTLDGTMGPSGSLSGPAYVIPDTVGRTVGSNLFHSFGTFNIRDTLGESATFTAPSAVPGSIANVLSRVTGGASSTIDGLLRSTIVGANFYFMNPAGVVFGPHATLDVQGSFHVTTADYLRLGDGGGIFYADVGKNSILTSPPPSAFGFLSDNPAPITFEGSGSFAGEVLEEWGGLKVPERKTFSVVGGDITVNQGLLYGLSGWDVETRIHAPGGRINVASVASAGEVVPGPSGLALNRFTDLGNVEISGTSWYGANSKLLSTGPAGGDIYIRGGRLVVDGGEIQAETLGTGDGGRIDIELTGEARVQNGGKVYGKTSGTGAGTEIWIEAPEVTISGTDTYVYTYTKNAGAGGPLTIKADTLTIEDGAFVYSWTSGSSQGGNLDLQIENLEVQNGGDIFTWSTGLGDGGNLGILATGETTLTGTGTDIYSYSGINGSPGKGGNITVRSNALRIEDNADAYTLTKGPVAGGDLSISVDGDFLASGFFTDIYTMTEGDGTGGDFSIVAGDMVINGGASIKASTKGTGGGAIWMCS